MKEEKIFYDPEKQADNTGILKGIEQMLKIGNVPFVRHRTTSTATYIQGDKIIKVLPKNTGINGNFIGRVKKHFNTLPLPEHLSADRPYYEYFRPISTYEEIDNLCEIDLTAAYYTAANGLGYLTKELYDKAFDGTVNKVSRLVAMGTLGKRTVTTEFNPPYEETVEIEKFDRNRVFWDNIVYTVGEVMREVVARYKLHVYGMWFDAIFVERSVAENIRKFLAHRGYPAKVEAIKSYVVKPKEGFIPGAEIVRIYANGKSKSMQVNYLSEDDKMITFEQFLSKVAKSAYI